MIGQTPDPMMAGMMTSSNMAPLPATRSIKTVKEGTTETTGQKEKGVIDTGTIVDPFHLHLTMH